VVAVLALLEAGAVLTFIGLRERAATHPASATARPRRHHSPGSSGVAHRRHPKPMPAVKRMIRASSFLQARAGINAFAVVDSRGREFGLNARRTYVSASVTKSMLLVAYLRALSAQHDSVGPITERLLYPMIHASDNNAASAVWRRVGDAGLEDVAHAAHMRDFVLGANWANELISPADMARFFYVMDSLIPRRLRGYAHQLLTSIDPTQSWGIPEVARPSWRVYFKGGWRLTGNGQFVGQVARLERQGRKVALAVMTDADPSMAYGEDTIAGVTSRLIGH
jgi:beta-lactamase class A